MILSVRTLKKDLKLNKNLNYGSPNKNMPKECRQNDIDK